MDLMKDVVHKSFSYKQSDLDFVVREIVLPAVRPGATLLLEGQLGAGKTTFVKALAKVFDFQDAISSPTFSYVNTYRNEGKGLIVYHFDLYRLGSLEEFINLGFDEFLAHPSAIKLVEWPEIIATRVIAAANKETPVILLHLMHDFNDMHHRNAELTIYE